MSGTDDFGFAAQAPEQWIDGSPDGDADEGLDWELEMWSDDKSFVAKDSCPLWSELEDGVFSHFHSSGAKLPAGTYRCVLRHGHGICLEKVESKSDHVFLLPDPVAESLIKEAQRFWRCGDDFRKLGYLHKRGFLVMGPAGCGKTCIINQLADYVLRELNGIVLLLTDAAHAESALSNLRQVEPQRPVLAVIEDIDAMLGDGREERLLSLLDGKTQVDHVLFIATTNYPERLDQRLLARPSRFDRVELIRPPSSQVRQSYLKKELPDLCAAELERWTELSEGFSIAHLKELILAVRLFGTELSEAAQRLQTGLKQKPTSDNFTHIRMGFGRAGR